MKGVVEIYGTRDDGSRDLLYQGENMTTVGFSENIVDMLTTPSSISLGGDGTTNALSGYLSAVNYKIQAFSVSKQEDQFSKNLHAYSTNNFLHDTNLAGLSLGSMSGALSGGASWIASGVTSGDVVLGPIPGVSGLTISGDSSSSWFGQEIRYDNTSNNFSGGHFSGTDFVFSVDLKLNRSDPPIQVSSDSLGNYVGYSQLSLSCNDAMHRMSIKWDNSGNATLDPSTASWESTGVVSGVDGSGGIKYLGGGWNRVFVHGAFLKDIEAAKSTAATVVQIFPAVGAGAGALVDTTNFTTTGTGGVGSIQLARPQLELGIHPTNYVENSGLLVRDNQLRFSLLNSTNPYGRDNTDDYPKVAINYYVLSDSGGPTLSGMYDKTFDKGVSAYLPPLTPPTPPAHPDDRELTPGVITPVESAFGVRINQGHNPACGHLWDQIYVSSYDNSWTYTTDYKPFFGRHLLYLGTYVNSSMFSTVVRTAGPYTSLELATSALYPSGLSSTDQMHGKHSINGSMYVHYISGTDAVGYEIPVSSTIIGSRSFLTTASPECAPDMYGYIGVASSIRPVDGPAGLSAIAYSNNGAQFPYQGTYRPGMSTSAAPDFSSTGEITYHLRTIDSSGGYSLVSSNFIPSATYTSDKALWNLFGGVTVVGLWGYDLKKIREDNIYRMGGSLWSDLSAYPPIPHTIDIAQLTTGVTSRIEQTNQGSPFNRYKLYNKKVLTDNIAKNEGFQGDAVATTSAGIFTNYRNLDLYWKVKFI
jgi:hypothetical protein